MKDAAGRTTGERLVCARRLWGATSKVESCTGATNARGNQCKEQPIQEVTNTLKGATNTGGATKSIGGNIGAQISKYKHSIGGQPILLGPPALVTNTGGQSIQVGQPNQ